MDINFHLSPQWSEICFHTKLKTDILHWNTKFDEHIKKNKKKLKVAQYPNIKSRFLLAQKYGDWNGSICRTNANLQKCTALKIRYFSCTWSLHRTMAKFYVTVYLAESKYTATKITGLKVWSQRTEYIHWCLSTWWCKEEAHSLEPEQRLRNEQSLMYRYS